MMFCLQEKQLSEEMKKCAVRNLPPFLEVKKYCVPYKKIPAPHVVDLDKSLRLLLTVGSVRIFICALHVCSHDSFFWFQVMGFCFFPGSVLAGPQVIFTAHSF